VTHLGLSDPLAVKIICLTIADGENVKISISMQHNKKFNEFSILTLYSQSAVKIFSVKNLKWRPAARQVKKFYASAIVWLISIDRIT